jgi:hypothetical protein
MLNMAAYALAGPIANPEKAAVTATENIKGASPTPIDIKLDLGTLGKIFPLPPELRKLEKSGEPLELKVTLGPPDKHEDNIGASQGKNTIFGSGVVYWDGGLAVEESTPYKPYKGNGSPEQGWPTPEQWVSYRSM